MRLHQTPTYMQVKDTHNTCDSTKKRHEKRASIHSGLGLYIHRQSQQGSLGFASQVQSTQAGRLPYGITRCTFIPRNGSSQSAAAGTAQDPTTRPKRLLTQKTGECRKARAAKRQVLICSLTSPTGRLRLSPPLASGRVAVASPAASLALSCSRPERLPPAPMLA